MNVITCLIVSLVLYSKYVPSSSNHSYEKAVEAIENGDFGNVHSLVIQKDGQVVLEKYFNGWKRDSIHQLQSATKSIVATFLGIALQEGFIHDLDQPVLEFFGDLNIDQSDERKKKITIRHLLTQQHGLAWKEAPWNAPDNNWRNMLDTTGNWYEMVLNTPMAIEPGTEFNYSNAAPLLITGIVQNASGMAIDEFTEKYLFGPLGIDNYRFWEGNGGPEHNGAALLFLKTIDFVKIGQLYLNHGKWEGKTILPEWFVEEATHSHVKTRIVNRYYQFGYGYFWWTLPRPYTTEWPVCPRSVFLARGAGGQHLIVFPEENMVVGINGWDLQQPNVLFGIFTKYLLPEHYKQARNITLFAEDVLSEKVETSPTLTPDGNTLYFSVKDSFYVMDGKSTILTARKTETGWTKPKIAKFSGTYNDGDPFISPDGKKLFFTSNRPLAKSGMEKTDQDIWFCENSETGWSEPNRLPSHINSTKSEYSPTVDNHGNLYFGSYREGGLGSGDIWVSYWQDGINLPPENLGHAINSDGGEWGSCISADGRYLIFEASGRLENFTESGDLYISCRENGVWQAAVNIHFLNTGGSDLTPKIHGDHLYFTSNRHPDFMTQFSNNDVQMYWVEIERVLETISCGRGE